MIPAGTIDQHTADTLHLMAGDPRKEREYRDFLAACWKASQANDGLVNTNDVRAFMSDEHGELEIHPRQFSAFFCRATAKDGPLRKTGKWAICHDPKRKNSGRPQPVRRWVGPPPQTSPPVAQPPAAGG